MSQLGFKLRPWHWILLLPRVFPRSISKEERKTLRRNFFRQVRALRLNENLLLPQATFPKIELLSVAAEKDLEVIATSLKSAIKFSLNPVSQVTVICPQSDIEKFKLELSLHKIHNRLTIISEDEILSQDLRSKIKQHFGVRYGWVLQQFLSLEYVLKSHALGILLTDADTIQLQRVQWLAGNRTQVLMASTEFHRPYYEILSKVFGFTNDPEYTFVTHHMLLQPALLRDILGNREYYEVTDILNAVLIHIDPNELSPLCIDFEPYGQGLFSDYPEYVYLKKFSNKGVSRSNLNLVLTLLGTEEKFRYNSISLHHYL